MSTFWRIALAWLLALALPMQGYAAQTMLLCGPANHHGSGPEHHGGHDHAGMLSEHASAQSTVMTPAPVQEVDQAGAAAAKHAGGCSVCASCCSAVAITAGVVSFAVARPDLPEVPTVQVARDRVMVGGLERPPRLPRA